MSFLVEPPALPVPQLHDEELAELNAEFERLPAPKIIQWAVDNYSPHLCLAASMQDAVLIDLATRVDPSIEVVFIDTGYHFPETLQTVEVVRRRYGLNLRMMTVTPHAQELWKVGTGSGGGSTRKLIGGPPSDACALAGADLGLVRPGLVVVHVVVGA
ncbi:MAG: phosphoadenosine phosphosulfate reductase family protein, partial [Candidatus Limnocylindrales bacterium]